MNEEISLLTSQYSILNTMYFVLKYFYKRKYLQYNELVKFLTLERRYSSRTFRYGYLVTT